MCLRCLESQHQHLAVASLEKEVRRSVRSRLVIDVDRRRRLRVAVDDDERHAALSQRCYLGVALVEADDHKAVHGSRRDGVLQRTSERCDRQQPDALFVGDASDPLEEGAEERIREHRGDRLGKEDAENTDPLRVQGPRVGIRGVAELARRVEDPRHRGRAQALGVVEGVRDGSRGHARFPGNVVDGDPAHAFPQLA